MTSSGIEPGTYPISDGRRPDLAAPAFPSPPRPGSTAGLVIAAAAALAVNGLALWLLVIVAPLILPAPERERMIQVFLVDELAGDLRSAQPEAIAAPIPELQAADPAALPPVADKPPPMVAVVLPALLPVAPAPAPARLAAQIPPGDRSSGQPTGDSPPPAPTPAETPSDTKPATTSATPPTLAREPDAPTERPAEAVRKTAPERTPVRLIADWAGNRKPDYPRMALRLGEQGEVHLSVLVDDQGRAVDVRITRSSGSTRLDQSAVDAVREWRFTPATEDGKAVADWYHDWRWEFRLPR